jgi:exodeoxyribonuclease VII small subunit
MFISWKEKVMSDTTAVAEVTFEGGYEELKGIVARLDAEDVSVHEMCELFARGKGLEKALRGYLTTRQGKLDEIEAGENLPEFAIVAPSAPEAQAAAPRIDVPDFGGHFAPVPAAPAPPRQSAPGDDDIPF